MSKLGPALLVLRRHVRHQLHDQPPDNVVVDDSFVSGLQKFAQLDEEGRGVADDVLVFSDVHGVDQVSEVEHPIDLRNLLGQLADGRFLVDGTGVDPLHFWHGDVGHPLFKVDDFLELVSGVAFISAQQERHFGHVDVIGLEVTF